jgi:hypothetical protein
MYRDSTAVHLNKKRKKWQSRVEKNFAGSGSKKGYVKSYKGLLTGLA